MGRCFGNTFDTATARSGPRPRYTNRHRRQTVRHSGLCDTTTRIAQPNTSHTRHHKNTADRFTSQHLCCLRRTGVHNGSRDAQPYPSRNHRGHARGPQPRQLSWHADFAREKEPGCAADSTTYLALQRQHGHEHAMEHARRRGGEVCDNGNVHMQNLSRCRPPARAEPATSYYPPTRPSLPSLAS